MLSWFAPLLFILTFGAAPVPEGVPHDFHVTYSRLAVEDNMAVVRIRLFQDDLNQALSQREERDVFVDTSPTSDSLFQAYFNEMFVMQAGKEVLKGHIVGSGEEVVGNEPMWWYLLEFGASSNIETLHVSQRILSDEFEDQKNIVQVQHFPSEKVYSLYCVEDAWEYTVDFNEE
ncbi:MAG: DUF6702 family protein [Rhodothermales bacterium]